MPMHIFGNPKSFSHPALENVLGRSGKLQANEITVTFHGPESGVTEFARVRSQTVASALRTRPAE